MSKFRKKPVVVEAERWFAVDSVIEGRAVDYFRHPEIQGAIACKHCAKTMHDHGWISTLEGGHIVCPGDWIITGVAGEKYPCKDSIFQATYEPVEAEP